MVSVRISVDLDFFQAAQFHADELSQQLALEGITLEAEEMGSGTGILIMKLFPARRAEGGKFDSPPH
jgi:hypothetical protein